MRQALEHLSSATAAAASPSSAARRSTPRPSTATPSTGSAGGARPRVRPEPGLRGDFEKSAGEAAVELLVDERKVQFDALSRRNDYMALGAIPALEERDLQVPSDVAVVGFDDIEDARFSTPPLTTVAPAALSAGRGRARLVLAQLEGAEVAPRRPPPTELVVRLSCGCLSGLTRPGPRRHRHADRTRAGEPARRARRRRRAPDWRARCTAPTPRCRRAGIASCSTRSRRSCAAPARVCSRRRWTACSAASPRPGTTSAPGRRWSPRCAGCCCRASQRTHALGAGGGPVARGAHPDRRAGRARPGATPPAQRAARERADRERRHPAGHPAGRRPDGRRRPPAATAGIPSAWMALYDGATTATADTPARLVLAVRRRTGAGQGARPSRDAAPAAGTTLPRGLAASGAVRQLARRASIVVEPLFFHERPLGCLLLEMGPREGMVYESLAEQVSSALEGARLVTAWSRRRRGARSRSASGSRKRWRSPRASRRRSCRAT